MPTISIILVIAYLCILPIYIKAEKSFGFAKSTALKLVLSAIFVVNGVLAYYYIEERISGVLLYSQVIVVIGLIFAFFGDFFLQFIKKDKKKFHAGVVCFSITQILLLVSMTMNFGYSLWDLLLSALPIGIGVYLMNKQKWQLGDSRIFLSIYTVLISFMTAKAFMCLIALPNIANAVFAIGAALFFVSDILLGVWSFYKQKRIYANLNWITYFLGLILISLSIVFR